MEIQQTTSTETTFRAPERLTAADIVNIADYIKKNNIPLFSPVFQGGVNSLIVKS